jgi:hypothetical protein
MIMSDLHGKNDALELGTQIRALGAHHLVKVGESSFQWNRDGVNRERAGNMIGTDKDWNA